MKAAAIVEAPEAGLAATDHVLGNAQAELTLLEYGDYDMADHLYTQRVQEHRRAGARSGLRSAPAFFLNGQAVDVSFGLEKLEAAVQAALLDQGRPAPPAEGIAARVVNHARPEAAAAPTR